MRPSVESAEVPRAVPTSPSLSSRYRLLSGGLVFFSSLGLYAWTLAPTVTLVDSGELIVAARSLGVAHPPGFPLYVLLAHLATLVPAGSVAVRVNFASALFAAGAAAVVTFALVEGMSADSFSPSGAAGETRNTGRKRKSRPSKTPNASVARVIPPTLQNSALPAVTAGLLFACSRTLWSYATITEVYTLNTLLIALIVWCMFRWRRLILDQRSGKAPEVARDSARGRDWWLNTAALLFGLALGVHHVTVGLVLPAFAVLVLVTEGIRFFLSRRLLIAAAFAFAGLSVYVYLPIAASRSPLMNWGDPRTFERFVWHVTGRQYQVFFEADSGRIGHQLEKFFSLTLREFGPAWAPLALVLTGLGMFYLYGRSRGLFWFLLTVVLANLAYNVNYEIAEDKDAYYLPVFLAIALAVGFGTRYAVEIASNKLKLGPRLEALVSAFLLVVIPGVSLASSLPYNNRARSFIARDYVANIFSTVEPGGMLLTLDWQVFSPAFYLREIEGVRPDAVVIDINQLRRSWYFDYLKRAYPDTMNRAREQADSFLAELRHWERDPEIYQRDAVLNKRISSTFQELILSLISNHLATAPVYVTQDIATYREGPDSDWAKQVAAKYQLVPEGLVFQLFADHDFHPPATVTLVTRGLTDASLRFDEDDVVRVKVLPVYAGMLYNRGRYLAAGNHHEEAIEAFKQSLAIEPHFPAADRAMAESQAAARRNK